MPATCACVAKAGDTCMDVDGEITVIFEAP
jgi:hypothetical protein